MLPVSTRRARRARDLGVGRVDLDADVFACGIRGEVSPRKRAAAATNFHDPVRARRHQA